MNLCWNATIHRKYNITALLHSVQWHACCELTSCNTWLDQGVVYQDWLIQHLEYIQYCILECQVQPGMGDPSWVIRRV